MTLIRSKLISQYGEWNEKRRYKVGAVVVWVGAVWQNFTGANSDPSTENDWLRVGSSDANPQPYKVEFMFSGSQTFTLEPGVVLTGLFYNNSELDSDQYSKSGNDYTIITPTLVADDKIKFSGIKF